MNQRFGSGRWLVTGAGGMLGRDVAEVLADHGHSVTAASRLRLDITDPVAVKLAVAGHDVVINTAAWTEVDGAERDEAAATAVNGTGAANVAAACAAQGSVLIHVSSDYVFAGDGHTPYPEDAPTAPFNAYGRSKLAGERAVLALLPDAGYVVRTAWLYGAYGRNFVTTILRLAGVRDHLDVVDDQVGQPTWSRALAGQLVQLGQRARAGGAPPGIYHGTAAGETTWYDLARGVLREQGLDPDMVKPIGAAQFGRPARRPAYSVLGHARWASAGLAALPLWHASLRSALRHFGGHAA